MQKRLILIFLISCISHSLWAQKALKAFKEIEKGNMEKAFFQVEKALEKEPNDPANFFALAKLYSLDEFKEELIDSAHYYILLSDSSFAQLPDKFKSRYERKGMDNRHIQGLHTIIDSLAFVQSKITNTEDSYNHYLTIYDDAIYVEQARINRNVVAYQAALSQKTPEALSIFFKLYPQAPQASEARAVFENLYYQKLTEKQTKQAYIAYIKERPHTLFTEKAVSNLLDLISTTSDTSQIRRFCNDYAAYSATSKGASFLEFLQKGSEFVPLLSHYQNDIFHFYNFQKLAFESVTLSSLVTDSCKWIKQPFLKVHEADTSIFLSYQGDTLFNGSLHTYNLLGSQWLKVKKNGEYLHQLIHLSGNKKLRFKALDFKYIDDFTFAEMQADGWWLKTFTGHSLLAHAVDSIWKDNGLFFLYKGSKFAVATSEMLHQESLSSMPSLPFLYSDYELLDENVLWLASDDFETLVDLTLNSLIDLERGKLSKLGDYYLRQWEGENTFFKSDFSTLWSGEMDDYQMKSSLLAIRQGAKWALQDWQEQALPTFRYDSVRIFNSWLAFASDSLKQYLFFGKHATVALNEKISFKLLNAYSLEAHERELVKFVLLTDEDSYKRIYNEQGRVIWEGEALDIKVVSPALVYIELRNRQLLLGVNGEVYPLENIQAIGKEEDGFISILNKSKFGAYILKNNTVIKPQSESKLQVFVADSIYVFQKDNNYGLLNNDNVLLQAVYQDIKRVNDSLALVQIENQWNLINISFPDQPMEVFSYVKDIGQFMEPLFEIRKTAGFGILNEKGILVIPPIFNSIEQIRIKNDNFWIAERNLSEIDFKVLVYFNKHGEVLFKDGFTTAEFERNICE